MTRIPTFACDLTVRSSRGDVGLQLCDVALWLVRRDAQHKGEIYGKSRALLDLIKSRSRISRFTLDGMIGEVNRLIAQLNALPITPKQMIAGSKLKAEIEERRIARMTSSE
jgi:hypothetical protein